MPPTIVRSYQQEIVETMLEIARLQNWWSAPINLGGGPGPDGGSGIPVGDFAGQLIQSKVAFDTTEGESLDIPVSGASLVTNLNRIRGTRNRNVVIVDESTQIGSGIRVIEFHGLPVTVNLISGYTDRVVVAISGMGWPVSGSGIVNVSATDTLAQYLDAKIDGGNRITTTVLNPGGSEQLQINWQNIGLEQLTDVELLSPGDQEILAYGTATSIWSNRTKAQLGLSLSGHIHVESDIIDILHDATKIQGRNVNTATPASGQVYKWNGSNWIPSGVLTVDEKVGEIQQTDVQKATEVTILNFKGTAVNQITDMGGGKVDIDLSASGTGATQFTGLLDTPANYTTYMGRANQKVYLNDDLIQFPLL